MQARVCECRGIRLKGWLAASSLVVSPLAAGCDASHGVDVATAPPPVSSPKSPQRTELDSAAANAPDGADARVEAYMACIDFDCAGAHQAVVASGAQAVPLLLARLRTSRTDVADSNTLRIVAALGDIGDARGIPALRNLLVVESPLLRAEAVRALGKLSSEANIAALAARLDDSDPLVREAAVTAVAAANVQTAEPILRGALDRERSPHIASAIRRALRDLRESNLP